ncbi:MAG: hypothetical protein HYZ73_07620, partial [Elusimicrobia bacterium]|nr:hypothetical protein [Elusimicrobiota bacterium]
GTEAGGITFTNLTSECTIRIYTLTGELVRELRHQGGLPSFRWDVTNDQGEAVVSGVYLYDIRSLNDSKQGKLMIIR